MRTQLTSMGASSIKPLDPDLDFLLREWVEKAEADLEAAETGSQCGGQHPPPRNCRLPLPADRRKLPEGSADVLPNRVSQDSRDRAVIDAGEQRESRGRGRSGLDRKSTRLNSSHL